MINYRAGNIAPIDLIETGSLELGKDKSFMITDNPIKLITSFSSMTDEELYFFTNGNIEISLCIIETIPFLIFDFIARDKKMTLVNVITKLSTNESNVFVIINIEANNFCIKNIRVIGLDFDLIDKLNKSIRDIKYNENNVEIVALNLLNKYSDDEIRDFKVANYSVAFRK